MTANRPRGEREVSLGSLGSVVCRPGLRALEAIDNPETGGPLTAILRRFGVLPSLRDTVNVIFETQVDAAVARGEKPHTRTEIGEAVLEVGIDSLREHCFELIRTAWSMEGDEEDPGNA
jgi:hypothetical protein